MPVKIAITGGSGFLAAHLIRHLQQHNNNDTTALIAEIRTIDRRPFKPPSWLCCDNRGSASSPLPSSNAIPPPIIVHHCCDLLDSDKLEQALQGVDVVVHLARKSYEYLFTGDNQQQRKLDERYARDNLEATKSLLDTMFKCSVPRMVHVGDAFANMPPADNFGNSEEVHAGLPDKFLLGLYGETRARAELMGRERNGKEMANGQHFHALFLRPTLVYGEGESKLPLALQKMAQKYGGVVSDLAGPSNGMLQYIYAGNLAAIVAETVHLLVSEQIERYSGAFFYCMDDTVSIKFGEFCAPLVSALGYRRGPSRSQWATLAKQYLLEGACRLAGWEPVMADLSTGSLQFLFRYALGFSNRKMALILKYRPNLNERDRWMERTMEWIRSEIREEDGGGSEKRQGEKEVRQMG